ncbi:hypothetical protein FUAX_13440 [Fulvitalea axinellae]|uniref:Lipoprotein n=1 Tax=Fulvitalea axinellae TaxID=1182444 RepID=A0AAU9CPQ3_9BACT|nr:hypothetical protein FUAX_13440 [Fulvitalea axinellae]
MKANRLISFKDNRMTRFARVVLILLLFCSCTEEKDVAREPDLSLVKHYGIGKEGILYQFYEKFGFTDVCEHSRTYFKIKNFKLDKTWKALPLSDKDRLKINSISNKADSVKGDAIPVIYKMKDFYLDISLDMNEFIKDSVRLDAVNLSKGFYRVGKKHFEVYSPQRETIYYEKHSCDY